MNLIVIGIAEMAVSCAEADVLATYSLGSCLGVAVYDPALHLGGLIHCMLPAARVDPEQARALPALFVDTGVPRLLDALFQRGAHKARALVKVAGAANVLAVRDLFKIGERNVAALRAVLGKHELTIAAEDVGGHLSRAMRLEIGTGRLIVKSGNQEIAL